MYEFSIELKCHAPIIHFQHDKPGATLRATEVKPKLDRFLKKKVASVPDEWYARNSDSALDYKMRIEAFGEQKADKPHDLYYGNMGAANKKSIIEGNCRLHIVCFNKDLLSLIRDNITEFLAVTNFGTMQNKGFGSYLPAGKTDSELKQQIPKWLRENSGSAFCYIVDGYKDGSKRVKGETISWSSVNFMLDDIKRMYSVMKSGYNIRDTYQRSYLFEYFHTKNIGNEKARMKKEGVSPAAGRKFPTKDSDEYKYVRALLGVGEKIDYIVNPALGRNRDNIETVGIKNKDIERFSSPIFFKIIGDAIYIVANRINKDIYNKKFDFTNKKSRQSISISVPESFDVDDFLSYFVTEYNKSKNAPFGIRREIRKCN